MFESFFGLTTAPFQLSPDPDFYFDSRGHHHALSYLKYGVHQREGFVIITGEIGAGKTTLVRALLSRLDKRQVNAVQISNTQLDEDELLTAICQAFGIPVPGGKKAQLLGTLEAYFVSLSLAGRRALLVIDEAQNLGPRQAEELRMLSNFQLGKQGLLQSFLVGQPELRKLLAKPELEPLCQRVIASCHLAPMNQDETNLYVGHRLRQAGYKGSPIFDSNALIEIFSATEGIPRRINLLCNRLLVAAFLSSRRQIDADMAQTTAADMLQDLGILRTDRP
ncbi:MAG TPA: XrtA-associated ATPase [Rhodoferax sp.]|nr:XrtA-associated ATPase [Rhodoferax sp.]HPW30093.1 XrtA-associated ATPase [Rhodoferax sp.]